MTATANISFSKREVKTLLSALAGIKPSDRAEVATRDLIAGRLVDELLADETPKTIKRPQGATDDLVELDG